MSFRICVMLATVLLVAGCESKDSSSPSVSSAAPKRAQSEPDAAPVAVAKAKASIESTVPSLRVTTLDGGTFDLAAERGKWVVVNYWATWCSPCLKEMPELAALDAMREDVRVLGLAFEEIAPDAMNDFLKAHPVTYPIAMVDVYDPPAAFEVPRGLPTTHIIAPDGRIAKSISGPVTAADIEAVIAKHPQAAS